MQKGSNGLLPVHPTSIKYPFDPGVFRKCSVVGAVELQDSFYLTFLVHIVNLCLFFLTIFFFQIHHPTLISQGKKSITLCIACQLVYSLLVCLLQPFILFILWTANCSCYVGSNIYSNWALHYALVAMAMICCENVTVGGQCYTSCC